MRQAYEAGKAGEWSEFPRNDRLCAWSSVKLRESCNEAEQADEDRKSIAQLILQKEH